MQDILSVASGGLVGFTLGLVGGGGSILAVPLLVYVVRVGSPHLAIGTSAVAVAASAFLNLINHARAGNVKWACASVFAAAGIAGAAGGAALGKIVDGEALIGLFGLLMIGVGLSMLRRKEGGEGDVRLTPVTAAKLSASGLAVGGLSGFFGIGGGFLVVPGLIAATGMTLMNAIGSSLLSITAFGSTTATSYALSGLVDWRIAGFFILGGAIGGLFGSWAGRKLSERRKLLNTIFAGLVIVTGLAVAVESGMGFFTAV
ncbi:sulfite exporter TauE/SafE family protein [Hyphobacterium marinum]|uniref:Probable membrane transporter protein n=1 Tax=Hyphobacterium marinum TaxID=3116574 RepID=A0ABU7LXW6_9PROT|nr:sulfite exporter TauE/SafE family protein [Hyphobacterium sp. Y6023]MEE2565845.1 sulfite exporter TauE/SafE family protein [Hyphobacterium sp. Y6023]